MKKRMKIVDPAGNKIIETKRKSIIKYGADEQGSTGMKKEVTKFNRDGDVKKRIAVSNTGKRSVTKAAYGGDNLRQSFLTNISKKK